MTENQNQIEAQRKAYLEFLYTKAVGGDLESGGELSKIALGGNQTARELVFKMDQVLSGDTAQIPAEINKTMGKADIIFCLTHLKEAFEAWSRQNEVALEITSPPAGSTFEEFPELPLSEAAALIRASKPYEKGGVQLEDWPRDDQERMLRGELPKGVPLHRNV